MSASFSAIFLSTLAASKTPPNVHDIFAKSGNGHFYIFYHIDTPKLIIAFQINNRHHSKSTTGILINTISLFEIAIFRNFP
ncbi:hypothetical protein HMPREF0860_1300 [Treponema socranskii subsp. socranskii VPI DR56BR1116 = ATCC 35536]|uniref:Uncharacterized protein n=1 Tax=Treponema socranskii subsp. socranskii VPI DR56BR1116 = ATCC 35536 TaxID=1125725 RepID=U2MSV1_TRESO|nr:hypothetical protein HMPREF1325_1922 [Treponema socranskii subsp. socranskii VPI DR56BR1116 = ATCC 35536]ERK04735.1 hypothetical protein HMPREF0860_1300 [Treponema socranskii subsp. socranskii VPI DR56BR1116 = ATCC 35536]